MIITTTKSVDDTRELAGVVAGLVREGDVILLSGELATGKTAFTQGLGAALGVDHPITSPTFVLIHQYEGRVTLHHVDVYRVDQLQEIIDLGLPEMLDDGGVAVIEWGDLAAPALTADYLYVTLELGESEDERRLTFRAVGQSWVPREAALQQALERWRVEDGPR